MNQEITQPERTSMGSAPPPELKLRVRTYFHEKADEYTDRHYFETQGGLLWARHRAILEMIREGGLPSSGNILDVGCGPGLLSLDLATSGYRGLAVDVAPAMIDRCKKQAATRGINTWNYQVGDAESLAAPDCSFDAVIAAGVIEYLPGDDRMMREVWRVLKPGGCFILNVTNRYGYTACLTPVLNSFKRLPGVLQTTSWLRRILVGGKHGAIAFNFSPRKHRPAEFRDSLLGHGFRVERDQYLQFTCLPAPFCTLTERLTKKLEDRLDVFDHTWLRSLGSCYLVSARKCEITGGVA